MTPAPSRKARALIRCCRRFVANQRGATMVEFGMIAFPFFAVIAATFETAYVRFENEALQGALFKAFRQMKTGQLQTGGISDVTTFKSTYLCQANGPRTLPRNFDCNKLIIAVAPVATFTASTTSKVFYRNTTNPFCPASPGQITMVKVAYPLGTIFPLNMFDRNAGLVHDIPGQSGWYHLLMGSALFQVENYTGAYTPPKGC